ncbi:MAG: ankyrin repeat domain-containing protein [Acidiferrobacterales bacterium]
MKRCILLIVVFFGTIGSSVWAHGTAEDMLFRAAQTGNLAMAKSLVARGAKVNARDQFGDTPLHWAAGHGNTAVVRLLIAHGADVNARDLHGETPLFGADNKAVVDLLLEHGALVNGRDVIGQTPLDKAAWRGRIPVIKSLIAHGADVNARDVNGYTALDNAAWSGSDSGAVEALLRAHGAVASRLPGMIGSQPSIENAALRRMALGSR